MSVREIVRIGHPVLREVAAPVDDVGAVQGLVDDLIETMRAANGAGLAANQIGVPLQVCVIEVRTPNPRYPYKPAIPLTVLVNPDITVLDEGLLEDWEGCLSIPDLRGRVPRHARLRVDALDRHGNRSQFAAEGFFARVVQHEFDHLMGRVYPDRMRDFGTLTHLDEFQRFWISQSS